MPREKQGRKVFTVQRELVTGRALAKFPVTVENAMDTVGGKKTAVFKVTADLSDAKQKEVYELHKKGKLRSVVKDDELCCLPGG